MNASFKFIIYLYLSSLFNNINESLDNFPKVPIDDADWDEDDGQRM